MVSECMETSLPSKRERVGSGRRETHTRGEGNRAHPSEEATPMGTSLPTPLFPPHFLLLCNP